MILEDGENMPPVKRTRKVSSADDDDEDYRRRRDRNNELHKPWIAHFCSFAVPSSTMTILRDSDHEVYSESSDSESFSESSNSAYELAVKKSRYKTKQRTQETFSRVSKLKAENQMLEEKVKTLTKELQFLKELFLAHASNGAQNPKFEGIDLEKLLEDVPDNKDSKKK